MQSGRNGPDSGALTTKHVWATASTITIPDTLHNLFANVKTWIERKSYPADEMGVLFHYHLVSIHPFPNGNGRHARLMGDLLNENVLGQPAYTWGGADLSAAGDLRDRYIQALKAADERVFVVYHRLCPDLETLVLNWGAQVQPDQRTINPLLCLVSVPTGRAGFALDVPGPRDTATSRQIPA